MADEVVFSSLKQTENGIITMALNLKIDSERSATPRCQHFGECGGCSFQDVEYEDQLMAKKNALKEILERDIEIIPSPTQYNYRHRMDFVVAFGKTGFRKRGDYKSVVDLKECHLVSPRVSDFLVQAKKWIEELGIEGYNYLSHYGDLRYLVTRHAMSTDELMITAVTASKQTDTAPLLDKLKTIADSVVLSVQDRVGDDSTGDIQSIEGRETIIQHILGNEFEISPNCFFQNNLMLIDSMFEEIIRHVEGLTLDLYCGVGTIGISAARNCTKVIGVDIMEDNIVLAKKNAARNGIDNVEFVLDKANHWLAHYEGPRPDTVIVDPPRDGLPPKFIRKLQRLGAPKLVYVSCNPVSFARDLKILDGYNWVDSKAYDMFPQTPHMEMVNLLELKSAIAR